MSIAHHYWPLPDSDALTIGAAVLAAGSSLIAVLQNRGPDRNRTALKVRGTPVPPTGTIPLDIVEWTELLQTEPWKTPSPISQPQ